jgi:hypothetical protein
LGSVFFIISSSTFYFHHVRTQPSEYQLLNQDARPFDR